MSNKKTVILNTDRLIHMTKGREYKLITTQDNYYGLIDDIGEIRLINKAHFDKAKPKNKKPKKQKGLTKREYFAAKAMNALISNPKILRPTVGVQFKEELKQFSAIAIEYADSLIEELNKKKVNE